MDDKFCLYCIFENPKALPIRLPLNLPNSTPYSDILQQICRLTHTQPQNLVMGLLKDYRLIEIVPNNIDARYLKEYDGITYVYEVNELFKESIVEKRMLISLYVWAGGHSLFNTEKMVSYTRLIVVDNTLTVQDVHLRIFEKMRRHLKVFYEKTEKKGPINLDLQTLEQISKEHQDVFNTTKANWPYQVYFNQEGGKTPTKKLEKSKPLPNSDSNFFEFLAIENVDVNSLVLEIKISNQIELSNLSLSTCTELHTKSELEADTKGQQISKTSEDGISYGILWKDNPIKKPINVLTQEFKLLKISNKQLLDEKTKLETNLSSLKLKIEELNSRLDTVRQENILAEQKLEKECKNVSLKIKELEGQKYNIETISDVPPSLSIQMDSLLELNQPSGWKLTSFNYEKIKQLKMITVAVLGMYDVGKSWFCNEFTGKNIFTAGFNQRTDSINFHFPEEAGNLIGIIDTPGSNEAIRVTQKDFVERIKGFHETQRTVENEDEYMVRYKLLKNDARILQHLKERFIGQIADVLILICSKLSEKEQESIYKVIKHHQQISMERTKESAGKAPRENKLYIVHNYKMLTEINQVENQIQRDLLDSFDVVKIPMFNQKNLDLLNRNQDMYQDQFEVSHLILAANGTNAGEYYNKSTFAFLKQKINVIEHRTSANVNDLFLDFCNKNLPLILKQETIKLKFNSDQTAIVKEDGANIVLENVRYDEFGNFFLTSAFEPKYSINERKLDNNLKEIRVLLEVLDSKYVATVDIDQEGYWLLRISGEKSVMNGDNHSRERGKFNRTIRLTNLQRVGKPRKEGPTDGIVQYIFEFRESEPESIE